jgi:hypothetical protein
MLVLVCCLIWFAPSMCTVVRGPLLQCLCDRHIASFDFGWTLLVVRLVSQTGVSRPHPMFEGHPFLLCPSESGPGRDSGQPLTLHVDENSDGPAGEDDRGRNRPRLSPAYYVSGIAPACPCAVISAPNLEGPVSDAVRWQNRVPPAMGCTGEEKTESWCVH